MIKSIIFLSILALSFFIPVGAVDGGSSFVTVTLYSVDLQFKGQDPVLQTDLHDSIYNSYQGTSSNTTYSFTVPVNTQVTFSCVSTGCVPRMRGWGFANWWDDYGLQEYNSENMTINVGTTNHTIVAYFAVFYYSNFNEGAKIVGDSNSVTVSLTQPITSQLNSTTHQYEWWSYQYNLFWSNSSSSGKYPFMSQTTFDDNSGVCKIGTGYGTHTEQIQQPIDCPELTQAGDSWRIVTTWDSQNLLSGLSVYVDGIQRYSITMATICKGILDCSVSKGDGAYFQSVFVGRCSKCGGHQSVMFTSLSGSMSYSGISPMTHYPACTSEFSNAMYAAFTGSGNTFSQYFTYTSVTSDHCNLDLVT